MIPTDITVKLKTIIICVGRRKSEFKGDAETGIEQVTNYKKSPE